MNLDHPAWKGQLDCEFLKAITGAKDIHDIEALDLDGLGLEDHQINPDVFNNLKSLVELNVSKNKLTMIPKEVVLDNLEYLDISNNNVNDVEWLARFQKLKDVDIFENASLTVVDRYKILFLLPNLKFLDGKGVEEREKIGEKFTLELLSRMENMWIESFNNVLRKDSLNDEVGDVLQKFTKMTQEKISYGPHSLKRYRLWRIKSIAEDIVKLKHEAPDCNLMEILGDKKCLDAKVPPQKSPQKHKVVHTTENLTKKPKLVNGNPSVLYNGLSDYKPFAFLQCHSDDDGPNDFSTQVWCCIFEPCIDDSEKTTNVVATCGGNKVCFIDCNTAKVQARFEQNNEVFYTGAWTTITLNDHPTNIFVAAGSLGFIHLIHPSQGVNYGRIKVHSSPIQNVLFVASTSTHLLSADKNGNIFLIDIDTPTVPEYKFKIKKLVSFNGLQVTPLHMQLASNNLLVATEGGLFVWKTDIFKSVQSACTNLNVPATNIAMECEVTFPHVDAEECVFDALEMLSGDIAVTKCSMLGMILLWRVSEIDLKLLSVRKKKERKISINILAKLKWSLSQQCYMNISVCKRNFVVVAGDDKGNIWMYDVASIVKSQKKNTQHPDCLIEPKFILPFPQCCKPDGSTASNLRNKTIYNDICITSDIKCIVVAADNNIVAIYQQAV